MMNSVRVCVLLMFCVYVCVYLFQWSTLSLHNNTRRCNALLARWEKHSVYSTVVAVGFDQQAQMMHVIHQRNEGYFSILCSTENMHNV